jgi:hypothetical protein
MAKQANCNDPKCKNYGKYARYCMHVTGSLKPVKPIPVASKKMVKSLAEYQKIAAKFKRDHPVCQAQLKDVCKTKTTDVHHMKGKIGELLTDTKYFLAVCRSCHSVLETNPLFARERGFSLSRHKKESI